MPTLEDSFYVFLTIKDENFNPVIEAQVQCQGAYEPVGDFTFDTAHKLVIKMRDYASNINYANELVRSNP